MEQIDKFSKFENETDNLYIIRMCEHKDEYGLNWKELAKEINSVLSLDYDESAYRKRYQYFKSCLNDKQDIIADEKGVLEDLENKRIEVKKEVMKLQTLRIDDNRKIREQSRNDLYFEEVLRAIKDNENSCKYDFGVFKELSYQKDDEEYLLSFSDVHFGKEFSSINNSYNIETVYVRFEKLLIELKDLIEKNKIRTLNVCALGDLIEGMTLRVSQLSSLRIGIVDQTIKFTNFLIEWLQQLSAFVKIKYYSVVSSNHSQLRPFNSKPNEFVNEDMERIIIAMLENAFKDNDRVEICTNNYDKNIVLDIFSYKIILLHGHEFKDLDNLLKNLSWQYNQFFDYAIVGHLHQGGVINSGEKRTNNCEVIRCPSIMGSDEYSDSLCVGSKSGALLIKFTRKQGKRSIEDIILN